MHTNRYLHRVSNHYLRQKHALMRTLVDQASRICEPQSLEEEFELLFCCGERCGRVYLPGSGVRAVYLPTQKIQQCLRSVLRSVQSAVLVCCGVRRHHVNSSTNDTVV